MINSRSKGKAAELEVVHLLRCEGWPDARRTSDGREQHARGDFAHGPQGVSIEAKRRETLQIMKWWEQTCADASPGDMPVLAFRQSNRPWLAVIELSELLPLLKMRESL